MRNPPVTHEFVRSLTKRLKARFGIDAKHTEVLEQVAGALGMSADALMHMLKNAPADPARVPGPDDWKLPYLEMARKAGIDIGESVQPDGIVCLLDGEKRVMLKRHLMVKFNLTPERYREIFNLPDDYPLVAPRYEREKRIVAWAPGVGGSGMGLDLPPDVLARVKPGFMRHVLSPLPLDRSVTADFIVCLLDRVAVTSLRDHLAETFGLSESHYRKLFKLPDDYPMTVEEARNGWLAGKGG